MEYLTGNYFSLVDKGMVRKSNDDHAATALNAFGNVLLIVADGMGGAAKGEFASKTACKSIVSDFQNLEKELTNPKAIGKWLNKVISKANTKIYNKSEKNVEYKGMGTTLSLVMIVKNILVTAQVGDSRVYLLKDNKLTQISVDQTYAQYLVNEKKISYEEAMTHKDRHVLTNALGTKKKTNIDIQSFEYNREKILLCSDGLYNNVPPTVIESILKGNDSLDRKCFQLINYGNANGGSDNMAVVIWESK